MTGFVKADICRQVSVCWRVFCGILFALKPFHDYSLCSVCILLQSAFYSQSVVCILHSVCILPLVRNLRSAVRSPQSSLYTDRMLISKLECWWTKFNVELSLIKLKSKVLTIALKELQNWTAKLNVVIYFDFWRRWNSVVYVWTDENGGFWIRWSNASFTASMTHQMLYEGCYRISIF